VNDDRRGRRAARRGSPRAGSAGGGKAGSRAGDGRAGDGRAGGGRAGDGRAGGGGRASGGRAGRDGAGRDSAGRDRGNRDRKGRGGGAEGPGRNAAHRRGEPATRLGAKAPSRPEPRTRGPVTETRPGGEPEIPADVSASQLDPSLRAGLKTLPRELAERVARHLAAAEQAGDPDIAYQHSVAARRLASRVGVVREACGVAAYLAGRWAEALSELRAARRLTGRAGYTAIMADCERALGRYDRALALVTGPDAEPADRGEEVEMRIVESGIRRDMGAAEAAVVLLQLPELTDGKIRPWSARLYYAYADALLDVGRTDEARDWFWRAAAADSVGETDAAERFDELDDVAIEDLEDAENLETVAGLEE
jgi:hypothetical protein